MYYQFKLVICIIRIRDINYLQPTHPPQKKTPKKPKQNIKNKKQNKTRLTKQNPIPNSPFMILLLWLLTKLFHYRVWKQFSVSIENILRVILSFESLIKRW